jgi:micrococcal nuclease
MALASVRRKSVAPAFLQRTASRGTLTEPSFPGAIEMFRQCLPLRRVALAALFAAYFPALVAVAKPPSKKPAKATVEASLPSELIGKVVGVHDGDTVTLLVEKRTYKVRLDRIDAPEIGQDFGTQSKKALSEKVFGKLVRVVTSGKDRYGRVLGTIWVDDQPVNRQLVAEGWAWHYKEFSNDKTLAEAEDRAKEAKAGLWAGKDPTPPWDWRKTERERRLSRRAASAKRNVAARPPPRTGAPEQSSEAQRTHWLNTDSDVRHNPSCRWHKSTKAGRMCGPNEGRACKICGG